MASDQDINIKLRLEGTRKAQSAFRKLGQAAKKLNDSFKKLGSSIAKFAKSIAIMGAAAVAAGAAIFTLTKRNAEYNDTIAKLSQQTGVAVETLQELGFAGEQVGLSQDSLAKGFKNLSIRVGVLQLKGTGTLESFFKENDAGFLQTLKGAKDVDAAFELVIARLRIATSEQERNSIAGAVFGTKIGPQIAQFARLSAAELNALKQEARDLGIVLGGDALKQSELFNDTLNSLQKAASGTSRQITSTLEPAFISVFETLTKVLNDTRKPIVDLISAFVSDITPAIADFIALLTGQEITDVDARAQSLFDKFTAIGAAISGAVEVAKTAFGTLAAILDPIAKLLGIEGGGIALALGLIVAQLTGFIGVIGALVGAGVALFGFFGTLAGFVVTLLGPAGIAVLAAKFAAFGAVLKAFGLVLLANPIFLIAAVITAVIVAIGLIIKATIGWDAVLDALKATFKALFDFVGGALSALVGLFVKTGVAIVSALLGVLPAIFDFGAKVVAGIAEKIAGIGAIFLSIGDGIKNLIGGILGVIKNLISGAFSFITDRFTALIDKFKAFVDKIKNFVKGIFNFITGAAKKSEDAVNDVVGAGGSGAIIVGGQRLADGGPVRGPGGPRADKVPLWGSNGEFMMSARAVRMFGVNFMRKINSGIVPKLQSGGLICDLNNALSGALPRPIPALAGASAGSRAGPSGRPLNLMFPGVGDFQATMQPDVIKELQRKMRRADSAKTGGYPRWYR